MLKGSWLCITAIALLATFLCATHLFAGTAQLTWNKPTTDVNGDPLTELTGYKIYYGTTSRTGATPPGGYNGAGSPVTITDPDQLTYTFNNLADGNTWYFSVAAYNSAGDSDFSNEGSKQLCTYAITPASSPSLDASGGSGSAMVTSQAGCTWTATESLEWVTITSGASGSGSGTVNYTVTANEGSGSRTGNIGIADKTHAVNQSGGYVVDITKTGSGTVTGNPAGINCGVTCSYSYNVGTSVALTASPAAGYAFGGWLGSCSGTGSCALTMDSAKSVIAGFYAPDLADAYAEVICPTSVTTGAALNVGMKIHNRTCGVPLTFTKTNATLLGNAGGTLSGIGIYGPQRSAINVTAGAPICPAETVSAQITVPVVTAVNASLAGKSAQVMIEAMTADGQVVASGECMVPVQ